MFKFGSNNNNAAPTKRQLRDIVNQGLKMYHQLKKDVAAEPETAALLAQAVMKFKNSNPPSGKKVETDMDFARIVTANAVLNIGQQIDDGTPIFNILTLIVHAPMDELMQMC